MIFSELIINDKNWKHLCNAFNNDRLPHALLFHGKEPPCNPSKIGWDLKE